ncbi:plasmid partitioning protein RepA [Mangrovicoccus sp. HB161399]|uniref:plasmid partitioning protein RepA n=1 Tax=Mangrovicoccus sp. HB161399 TaxID=2720392 RepID=UPI0015578665|nr:plasmid partitioning protein RepA [Mangrovicoccus sp. HB161399]
MKDIPSNDSVAHERLASRAEIIRAALLRAELASWAPESGKALRRFTSAEAAYFLNITQGHLRRLHAEERIEDVAERAANRRVYSEEEIQRIRAYLEKNAKTPGTYLKGRREGDKMQVIAVSNFKGGSAKTSTTAHLAHGLGMQGYRVLCIDADPQGSLTSLFGFAPTIFDDSVATLYDVVRYDGAVHIEDAIQKTHFSSVDMIPASLQLAEFEHETPMALINGNPDGTDIKFDQRLRMQLGAVEDKYDVVLIDCPPQLGFITLSALCAASGIIITVIPAMLDIASMEQFLTMAAGLLESVAMGGEPLRWDFEKFLLTRFEPNDGPSQQMAAFLRSKLGEDVLLHPFVKSTAVGDASMTKQSIYEVARGDFHRQTYDRAFASVELVVRTVENELRRVWGREALEMTHGA